MRLVRMKDGSKKIENWQWLDILAPLEPTADQDYVPKRRGVDPMTLPLDVLTKSGHPRRPASMCLRAHSRDLGLPKDYDRDRGLKRLRDICLDCSGGSPGEVANCSQIHCPLWAHRTGHNPYNRRKSRA